MVCANVRLWQVTYCHPQRPIILQWNSTQSRTNRWEKKNNFIFALIGPSFHWPTNGSLHNTSESCVCVCVEINSLIARRTDDCDSTIAKVAIFFVFRIFSLSSIALSCMLRPYLAINFYHWRCGWFAICLMKFTTQIKSNGRSQTKQKKNMWLNNLVSLMAGVHLESLKKKITRVSLPFSRIFLVFLWRDGPMWIHIIFDYIMHHSNCPIWFMDPSQWFFVIVVNSAVACFRVYACMHKKIGTWRWTRKRSNIFMRKYIYCA